MSQKVKQLQHSGTSAANITFPFLSTQGWSSLSFFCFSNAAITMNVLWSPDGVNTDLIEATSVSAGTSEVVIKDVKASYVSVSLVVTGLSTIRLNSLFFLKTISSSLDLERVLENGNDTGGNCITSSTGTLCLTATTVEIDGDLEVTGDIIATDFVNASISESSLLLNSGNVTTAGTDCYLLNNYQGTTSVSLITGNITAGILGSSNPTFVTDATHTFVDLDIISVTGCNLEENDQLYQVLSQAAGVVTIRGKGLTNVTHSFFSTQVTSDTVAGGTMTLMNVSALRCNSVDGKWQESRAPSSNTTSLAFSDIGSTNMIETYSKAQETVTALNPWKPPTTGISQGDITYDSSTGFFSLPTLGIYRTTFQSRVSATTVFIGAEVFLYENAILIGAVGDGSLYTGLTEDRVVFDSYFEVTNPLTTIRWENPDAILTSQTYPAGATRQTLGISVTKI